MAAPNSQLSPEPMHFTEYGIPIRNLWHMLLYAWNEFPMEAIRPWAMTEADVERAPTLDALLASILLKLMQGRLRIGLGRNYVYEEDTVRGIRGRIDFEQSIKRQTFERGEAVCEYPRYSANEPRNQIICSTIARLAQAGQFGPENDPAKVLRHELRQLTRDLDGIDLIELSPEVIRRQLQGRNDKDYRVMLAICDLVLQRQMPTESAGRHGLPELERDALVLYQIYERFVANFYRNHLRGWNVISQKRLAWHEKAATSQYLPSMIPDLILQHRSSGQLVILDTKFTAHSLVENQWGKPLFDSSHLYQLYAYLRSQEHVSEAHSKASGILLYPAVGRALFERMELQDHVIRVESLDLSAPWQDIERQLLDLVEQESPDVQVIPSGKDE
jgi:5-methylcytosine-specific restriction enzyme subunit McrC